MFIDYLRFQKRMSSNTLLSYENDLNQFEEYCIGNQSNVEQADFHLVRGWIVEMIENKISVRSVNRKLSTLKSFYRFLIREGQVVHNPLDKIVTSKTTKRLPVFVEQGQILHLLDEIDFGEGLIALRNRLIIEMFYRTGIRLSELINLKDYDVDTAQKTIKVLGKRNKERLIPFASDFVRQIEQYRQERNDKISAAKTFFLGLKGKKMYEKEVYRIVHKYLSMVTTLEKKSPHVIRHTFATHLLNNGADLNAIKELLGHANLTATQIYTHNSFEKLKEIYKKAHPRA